MTSRVELFLQCMDLPDLDVLSKSDPFVVAYTRYEDTDKPTPWKEVGRTETIYNERNPSFSRRIETSYAFNHAQGLRFEVYDRDARSESLSKHDFIGYAEVSLARLLTRKGQKLLLELKAKGKVQRGKQKRGTIRVAAEESSTAKEFMTLKFAGNGLKGGASLFGQKKPFYIKFVAKDEDGWSEIGRTALSKNSGKNKNVTLFDAVKLRMQNLKHMTGDAKLHLEVYKKKGSLVGRAVTTWGDLRTLPQGKGLDLKQGTSSTGNLVLQERTFGKEDTFLDYIAGGHQIELAVGIDFTQSNGKVNLPSSLHYCGDPSKPNDYERALRAVGNILANYDSDNIIPAYGFGARLPPSFAAPNHCFNITGVPSNPNCYGVDGLLATYRQSLQHCRLSGPTVFSDIIKQVAQTTRNTEREEAESYTILLLLTDGALSTTDLDATVHEIVQASRLPLSIVIVGVGSADFSTMVKLDADETPLVSQGRTMAADIVQFVPFRKFENSPGALAAEVLEEIPHQFMSYMARNKKKPRPPLQSDTASVRSVGSRGSSQIHAKMSEGLFPDNSGAPNQLPHTNIFAPFYGVQGQPPQAHDEAPPAAPGTRSTNPPPYMVPPPFGAASGGVHAGSYRGQPPPLGAATSVDSYGAYPSTSSGYVPYPGPPKYQTAAQGPANDAYPPVNYSPATALSPSQAIEGGGKDGDRSSYVY